MVRPLRLAHFFVLEVKMEQVGILSEIDSLGRLHLPKKIRDLYALEREIELVLTDEGVFLRNPHYTLTKRESAKN